MKSVFTENVETKLCDKKKTKVVSSEPSIVEIVYEHSTEIQTNPLHELKYEQEMRCDEESLQELEASQEMRCDEESLQEQEMRSDEESVEEPQDSIEITNDQYLEVKQILQDPVYQVNDITGTCSTAEVVSERTPVDVVEWTEVLVYSDLGSVNEKNATDEDPTAKEITYAQWRPDDEVIPPISDNHGGTIRTGPVDLDELSFDNVTEVDEADNSEISSVHDITSKTGPVDVDEMSFDDVTEVDEADNSETSSVKGNTADSTQPFRNTLMELHAIAEDIRFVMGL